MLKHRLFYTISTLLGLCLGIGAGLLVTKFAGENPMHVLQVIVHSAFGSRYDLGLTLFYSTPLIFCGLSVAIALKAGLFSIGAEGQLNVGALAAATVGACFPHVPGIFAPCLALIAAAIAGGIWAWIPGWLRVMRGSHEVINTIMMNFIAYALVGWVVRTYLQNPSSQNPETRDMGPAYFIRTHDPIAHFFGDAPVSMAFPIVVFLALLLWLFLEKTKLGFEVKACGENEDAARLAGIPVKRVRLWAMALAGALAGWVALPEVLGNAGRYRIGFSADYGFIGIAVALLAQNNPLLVVPAGILFGALHKGAGDLDIETEHVTRDLSLIIQALVILSVSLSAYFPTLWMRWRKKS
jgi:simple sugar transport system permease protein